MKNIQMALLTCTLAALLLAACATVDLNAAMPAFETGVDPHAWAKIPAGEFLSGQEAKTTLIDYDYEMMVADVTVSQYTDYFPHRGNVST